MSDNNLNPEPNAPQNGDIPVNNKEKEDKSNKPEETFPEDRSSQEDLSDNTENEKFPEDDNSLEKPCDELPLIEKDSFENISGKKEEQQDDKKVVSEDKTLEESNISEKNVGEESLTGKEFSEDPEEKLIIESEEKISEDEIVQRNADESIIEKKLPEVTGEVPVREDVPKEKIKEEKSEEITKPPAVLKNKESNYQISLIDENLLKVVVTTKKGVKIYSTVKESNTSTETQSNEIYLYPKIDYSHQEVEVLIAIEKSREIINGEITDEEKKTNEYQQKNDETRDPIRENEDTSTKSNYQINLINENLLKIKILTHRGVRIDSTARDKKFLSQTQTNKIYLKPKSEQDLQQIEITIAIEAESKELQETTDDGKVKLIPNPEVIDLIKPPDYSPFLKDSEWVLDERSDYKNPFDSLRKLIRKNLTIGIIAAVTLHLAAAGFAFYTLSKKSKDLAPEEQSRLIVIQDLPDPKIKLEDVEEPNKPKIEEPPQVTSEVEKLKDPKREIPPRRIVKPPEVTRPKKNRDDVKLDSSVEANLTKELDSLRRLRDSTMALSDTAKTNDTVKSAYEIPDSLKNTFNEKDIGLAMYFPKNWKLTDQREINKNEKDFKGVVLTDTTAEQPGTMTMFIFLDNENKDYNAEDFKTEFKMNDSTLSAFSKEPKTLAGFTEYRFYIFNKVGTEKLSLRASVRKQFFDQYKNEIEAVVRSIRIRKKEDM